jgi:hypothetical protein
MRTGDCGLGVALVVLLSCHVRPSGLGVDLGAGMPSTTSDAAPPPAPPDATASVGLPLDAPAVNVPVASPDAAADRPPDPADPPDAATADAAGCGPALLVVGTEVLTATDVTVRERLQRRLQVELVPELAATTDQAAGKSLVVITASATVVGTGTKFRDVPVPLILLEPNLMGLMQLTDNPASEHGATIPTETQLTITAPRHPLAGGLSGDVTVYPTPWRLTWGVPTPQAVTIATLVGRPRQQVIFAYPAGAMMVGLRAPATRVAFFLHDNLRPDVTAAALNLLDAAISWTAAPCGL